MNAFIPLFSLELFISCPYCQSYSLPLSRSLLISLFLSLSLSFSLSLISLSFSQAVRRIARKLLSEGMRKSDYLKERYRVFECLHFFPIESDLSLLFCLSACLSVLLSVCLFSLFMYLTVHLSVTAYFCISVCLSMKMSTHPSVRPFTDLLVPLYLYFLACCLLKLIH